MISQGHCEERSVQTGLEYQTTGYVDSEASQQMSCVIAAA